MFVYLLLTTALIGGLILFQSKLFIPWKSKSRQGKSEEAQKYVEYGMGSAIKLFVLCLPPIRKYFRPKDTVFDIMTNDFGTKNSKPTIIANFFKTTVVFPQDIQISRTILCNNDISNEKLLPKMQRLYYNGRGKGIIFNGGDEAKEIRRYTMKTLGKLGFGKHQMMRKIVNEQLTNLLEHFKGLMKSKENKIPTVDVFNSSVINIISNIVIGQTFSTHDKTAEELFKNLNRISNVNLFQFAMVEYFPMSFLLLLDRFGTGYQRFVTSLKEVNQYFMSFIEEKKLQLDKENPVDFVDHFLLEMEKNENNDDLNKIYCTEQLAYVLLDLFIAGMDTTSKFMETSLILLAVNPDTQVKVQEEIDSIIDDTFPSYSEHRQRMPFTQATIMEIHRIANILTSLARIAQKDFTFNGRQFKKGTFIVNPLFYFRMDECYWGDPKVFRPQRFLDLENNIIMEKVNHVMPFGVGSRMCLGEQVASATIFSFLTGILQKYNIAQSDHNEEWGLSKGFALVNRPEPFHVTLFPRLKH